MSAPMAMEEMARSGLALEFSSNSFNWLTIAARTVSVSDSRRNRCPTNPMVWPEGNRVSAGFAAGDMSTLSGYLVVVCKQVICRQEAAFAC